MPVAKFYFYQAQLERTSHYGTIKEVLDEIAPIPRPEQELKIEDTPCYLAGRQTFTRYTGYMFTRVRMTGLPPKVRNDGQRGELDLGDDEGLGEDVALAHGHLPNIVAIQANRHSLSATGIAVFLNKRRPEIGLRFDPIHTTDALERFSRFTQLRKLRLRLARVHDLSFLKRNDLSTSEKVLLEQFFQEPYAEIILSMGHGKGGLSEKARRLVDYFLNLFRGGNDCVKTLEISGKEDENSETMVVDLLNDRLVHYEDIELSKRSIDMQSLLRAACAALEKNNDELSHAAQNP